MLHRLKIDLAKRTLVDERLTEFVTEFPRVDDRLDALPTRFVYVPTRTDTLKIVKPPSATFNTIVKVDSETGDAVRHDLGNKIAGEPVFIPRGAGQGEDDGYLATFVFDPIAKSSDLILLDAAHVNDDPVAVIRLPQRVPQGLHGNWVSGARLNDAATSAQVHN
jgi:carotenoid cleavage dioxygenase